MLQRFRDKVIAFVNSDTGIPVLAVLAAGLYPLLYYYNTNFTLVNSWSHLLFFIITYLVIPLVVINLLHYLVLKLWPESNFKTYVIPVCSLLLFAFLIVISTYGMETKPLVIALAAALVIAIVFVNHFKKIVVVQLLMIAFVSLKLLPDLYRHLTYSKAWMQQPDAIESVEFKKHPNVYVIQPDGYAGFSQLKKGYYNFDNSEFETYLKQEGFQLFPEFRSNYYTTLSSNTSMFAMKHHYFNNPKPGLSELYNSREIIVGNNPVVETFNKNNYKTHLLLEGSYLLVNRPELAYDYCNYSFDEIPYLSRGFELKKNVLEDLKTAIKSSDDRNFYFIEKIIPGHVATYEHESDGKEKERQDYLDNIVKANSWLKDMITLIKQQDNNALIVIVADHGGFVGFDYTLEATHKQTDVNLIKSIFTSALAIKWPDEAPQFSSELKTNVNLFRVLFAYLSDDSKYLEHLQDDKSFLVIQEGAPYGTYEVINNEGDVVFKPFSND